LINCCIPVVAALPKVLNNELSIAGSKDKF